MLFNSIAYLLLMGVMRAGIALRLWPAYFLIAGSIIFYIFAGLFDASVFLASVVVNWLIAKTIHGDRSRIIFAVIFNIGLLFAFKYQDFILSFVSDQMSVEGRRSYIDITLPLGISFYTFQILAYHIDVARNHAQKASSFRSFFLFVAFFPQLVAGPIVRAAQLLPQIERFFSGRRRRTYLYGFGIALFVLGLFKKVVLADSIAPHVDEIFTLGPEDFIWAWLGAVLFAFQIYCDFSGYSDMAIGSAFLLGIRLPVNFKTPYLSKGPREFWQRWHITLSTWIRDYLYIPLGGNKGGPYRAALVLIMTMAIAGLWHGADITFALWGALWGLYIYMARLWPRSWRAPIIVAVLFNFIVTIILWVLFRAPDWQNAASFYSVMFGLSGGVEQAGVTFHAERGLMLPLIVCALFLCFLHCLENKILQLKTLWVLRRYQGALFCGFMLALTLCMLLVRIEGNVNPFIYFRF